MDIVWWSLGVFLFILVVIILSGGFYLYLIKTESLTKAKGSVNKTETFKELFREFWDARTGSALIVIATLGLSFIAYEKEYYYLVLPIIGIACFVIPFLLAFSTKYNLGTTLDNGEVRKSIAVSLTVVYILMFSLYFVGAPIMAHNQSLVEIISKDASIKMNDSPGSSPIINGGPKISISGALLSPLSISALAKVDTEASPPGESPEDGDKAPGDADVDGAPGDADVDGAPGDADIDEAPEDSNGDGEETEGAAADKIPTDTPLKNFLYVYGIIIIFYFGSRTVDDFAEVKMIETLTKAENKISSLELAEKRYILGVLGRDEFEEIKERIKGAIVIENIEAKKQDGGTNLDVIVRNLETESISIDKIYVNDKIKEDKPTRIESRKYHTFSLKIDENEWINGPLELKVIPDKGEAITERVTKPE